MASALGSAAAIFVWRPMQATGTDDQLAVAVAFTGVCGALPGAAQWVVLRRHLPITPHWILATMIGGTVMWRRVFIYLFRSVMLSRKIGFLTLPLRNTGNHGRARNLQQDYHGERRRCLARPGAVRQKSGKIHDPWGRWGGFWPFGAMMGFKRSKRYSLTRREPSGVW